MKVIGVGDNTCDKYEELRTMYPGGQALNYAVFSKMLGAEASYMGVFGRDEVADHILATLDELGVGDSFAAAFLLSVAHSREENPAAMEERGAAYREAIRAAQRGAAKFAAGTCLVHGAFGHGKAYEPQNQKNNI